MPFSTIAVTGGNGTFSSIKEIRKIIVSGISVNIQAYILCSKCVMFEILKRFYLNRFIMRWLFNKPFVISL